ncbi:MAG: NAD-dependent epimerase/dehydratase family protein [Chthoniobacterales bacterium]
MRVFITGICGFVGSTLALALRESVEGIEVFGCDNFIRPGSETNRQRLRLAGISVFHADIRNSTDIDALPQADWVIDAAANPSVLAGVDGSSSRQVMEHNLFGTINLLEYCKRHQATFTLLSTSRVYSIPPLANLPLVARNNALALDDTQSLPPGASVRGISETFSTAAPVSLYGSTKLASEALALEYGEAFSFPVWINRCGVLAGPGQFGRADQGIFSFWLNSWLRQLPLKYIGFGGHGHQVRDCLHPRDLLPVLTQQFTAGLDRTRPRTLNLSGGEASSISLAQLSDWCRQRFGEHAIASDHTPRPYDIGWMVLDSSAAREHWQWQPATPIQDILEEIAAHAEQHPGWMQLSSP